MRKSGVMGVAGDPRPESLCLRRPRAMVANRAETLGGDEASRFRTMPLSLQKKKGVSGGVSSGMGESRTLRGRRWQ